MTLKFGRKAVHVGYVLSGLFGATALALVPGPADPNHPHFYDGFTSAVSILRGSGLRSDFAQDYVGARALLHHGNAYPVLGPALAHVGLYWPLTERSTHLPGAFLFALPTAAFPWPVAAALWAWAQLALMGVALWAIGVRRAAALAAVPWLLLWPPLAWSVGQMTGLWLAATALAWRWRNRPALAGAALVVAATAKPLPLVLIVPFLLARRWSVLRGALISGGLIVVTVVALDARTVSDYLAASGSASGTMARPDNSGLVLAVDHRFGIALAVSAAAFILLVIAKARSWEAWCWAAVALLPIAWVYSLAPLALIPRRHPLAAVPLVLVGLATPFGDGSVLPLVAATLAVGSACMTPTRFRWQPALVSA